MKIRTPDDLNAPGALRAYTGTNWFDVLQVVGAYQTDSPHRFPRVKWEYVVVIDNGGTPVTIDTETLAII